MAAPRQIGPYQIVEELGRGAMGVVYRAFDPAIGRPLAIKLPHVPRFASEAEAGELRLRFAREANAAGRLSHSGIVTLYQFGQQDDYQYLAMELVPGGSLESRVKNGQPWPVESALGIVRQIAAALDYAHDRGTFHRDIKPANILMQPDGRVQVADFGIARMASQTITRTGLAMGTPSYMAPEQIEGEKVDGRADQFSLAVVAFRLLSGRLPFEAPSELALLLKIRNEDPASLTAANPLIPAATERVILRALAKAPEARFASCAEFSAALGASVMPRPAGETDDEKTGRSKPGPRVIKRPNSPSNVHEPVRMAVQRIDRAVLKFVLWVLGWMVVMALITWGMIRINARRSASAADNLPASVAQPSSAPGSLVRPPANADTKTKLSAAHQFADSKDYATAEDLYKQVVAAEPQNVDALKGLAAVLYREDKIDECAAVLERIPRN